MHLSRVHLNLFASHLHAATHRCAMIENDGWLHCGSLNTFSSFQRHFWNKSSTIYHYVEFHFLRLSRRSRFFPSVFSSVGICVCLFFFQPNVVNWLCEKDYIIRFYAFHVGFKFVSISFFRRNRRHFFHSFGVASVLWAIRQCHWSGVTDFSRK